MSTPCETTPILTGQNLPPDIPRGTEPELRDSYDPNPSAASNDVSVPSKGERKKNCHSTDEREPKPLDEALKLVEELGLVLFHTPDDEAFTSVTVNGHEETYPLEGDKFEKLFATRYYERMGSVLLQRDFYALRGVLVGKALYGGIQESVYVRVAEKDGAIYLDRANDAWEAVKITSDGWEVVIPPVRFKRVNGTKSLPSPTRGGSIELLRKYVNVGVEQDWKLLVAWLIAALRPKGPFPILALQGEQGSAKSTTAEVLRRLIDPNKASLRSAPRDIRDLMISAGNGWFISLENLSSVPPWLSDALCRLSTGAGFSTRMLYTDSEEKLIEAARPVILNGIQIGITNGDLFERTLMLTAPPITGRNRLTKEDFWRNFQEDEPAILGALLDAVACALRRLPEVSRANLPRMADFAVWVTAAEPALGWDDGDFLKAYSVSRQNASELALENSPLTAPIEKLMSSRDSWKGIATELLEELNRIADNDQKHQKGWPRTPGALSGSLARLKPDLKAIGLGIESFKTPGSNSKKIVSISRSSDRGSA